MEDTKSRFEVRITHDIPANMFVTCLEMLEGNPR